MIETTHGTIRVTYSTGKNKRRMHTLVHFVPGVKPGAAAEIFKDGKVNTNHPTIRVYSADVAPDSRDQFSKKDGRKKAIAKVLLVAPLTKAQRTEIWDELFRGKNSIKIV